ncbi:MAG: precorrin-4 C(11)-methyltransferase [Microcoleaceae cyanobacterium]
MNHPLSSTIKPAVYIVGAGSGDPELLTVKAYRLITQADVIVYADSLVPEQILRDIRPDAERVQTSNKTLEEIVPLMLDRVRRGQSVVRLHSGDPCLYSAIHEQMQRLATTGVEIEVVPGISAFQAAAASLKLELTVPELVQTIILTRVSGRATAVPSKEELSGLAAHQASLCLYLAARHVENCQAQLLEHYPSDTPVAICYRLGWPDEKIVLVSLREMAATSRAEKLERTTLYLISPALASVVQQPEVRSGLYNPEHSHLFRRRSLEKKTQQP